PQLGEPRGRVVREFELKQVRQSIVWIAPHPCGLNSGNGRYQLDRKRRTRIIARRTDVTGNVLDRQRILRQEMHQLLNRTTRHWIEAAALTAGRKANPCTPARQRRRPHALQIQTRLRDSRDRLVRRRLFAPVTRRVQPWHSRWFRWSC